MIVFASRTGNNKFIINQLGLSSIEIRNGLLVDSPFFLLTYTDGLGQVPNKVIDFMKDNFHLCKGVIASGNSNFGINNFCKSADTISNQYGVPVIRKIELRGFKKDYDEIINKYNEIVKGQM